MNSHEDARLSVALTCESTKVILSLFWVKLALRNLLSTFFLPKSEGAEEKGIKDCYITSESNTYYRLMTFDL